MKHILNKFFNGHRLSRNFDLPPFTIRCKFSSGYTPTMGDAQTLVDAEQNIWDIYKESNDWSYLFGAYGFLLEVLNANVSNVTNMSVMFEGCYSLTSVYLPNTSNVTDMSHMFEQCTTLTSVSIPDTSNVTDMSHMFQTCDALTSVPVFNTSNVTNMSHMFETCFALTIVPLFNTSNVTDMSYMFAECRNVQSGALALFQQAITQPNPPSNHAATFRNCGMNTETGRAELEQIPDDWK